jgi:hypothetical protein
MASVGSACPLSFRVGKGQIIRNDGVGSSNLSCGTNSGSDRSKLAAKVSKLVATTSFLASRGSTRIASRLGSSAVGPSALTVRTSPRSRRRNPLPFSDAPGWAIDIEAGRWAARPTCHGSSAHPRACASLAVDRPIGPSLPQRANVSPACPASSPTPSWALSPQLSRAGK